MVAFQQFDQIMRDQRGGQRSPRVGGRFFPWNFMLQGRAATS